MKKQLTAILPSPWKVISTSIFFITLTIISFMLCKAVFAESLSMAWDANTENDLAGYQIYYTTASQDSPYTGTGIDQGASPITVPLNSLAATNTPSIQLSGLSAGQTYFFTITAYNTSDVESDFSNIVSYDVPKPPPVLHTLTASVGGQGTISPADVIEVIDGESQSFMITPDAHHHIEDVLVDGQSVGPVNTYTFNDIATSHTIQAVFAIDTYSLIGSAGANGSIDSEGILEAEYSSTHIYKITPAANYHIEDVIVDGNSVGPASSYTFDVINASHTIEAKFAIDNYIITTINGNNGSIETNSSSDVAFGSTYTCKIIPDANYHIEDVIVDGDSVGTISSFTLNDIDANHTIEAKFAIDNFTLTASSGENGIINPIGSQELACGTSQTYVIAAEAGCLIADVKVDGDSIGAVNTYTFDNITKNHSIEAIFENEPQEFRMEAGEVTIDHNWQQVTFSQNFISPVVVASALSADGSHPSVVRIDNVTPTGFEISVQEWDYLDGSHMNETVGYIVMEAGSHKLPDGSLVEASTFNTDKTGAYEQVKFAQKFNQKPILISAINSFIDPDTVASRVRNVSTTMFEYKMQEQEANSDGHASETVSYIAWEPINGSIDGIHYEIGSTSNAVTQDFKTISFNQPFATEPVFLAAMQTVDGPDPSSVRWDSLTSTNVQVKVEEEQSKDSEQIHTSEIVGYMAFAYK
jgi:predicted ester cyclase